MEKPTTKKEVIEYLKDLRALEITARDSYKDDVDLFENRKLKVVISVIEKDEEKHIELLNEMIEILEK